MKIIVIVSILLSGCNVIVLDYRESPDNSDCNKKENSLSLSCIHSGKSPFYRAP